MRREILREAVFLLKTPLDAALSIFEAKLFSAFLASSLFFDAKKESNFLTSVLISDFVARFLACLLLDLLTSLKLDLFIGNLMPSLFDSDLLARDYTLKKHTGQLFYP